MSGKWPHAKVIASKTVVPAPSQAAGGPVQVQVRAVVEGLGLQVEVRGKLEPLRAKLVKLADRGWLHKRGDGKFIVPP